ncbi:hypothetical protein EPA93_27580 [Ktedonosporobacter rubrisoli]|uniref:Glycosyltransferase RgtA/B/C/D-like domain-containing protein n=1 Tax=Ktedonosporobacter rubrisoli TaxID=2509675 RepID=A0A4P6JV64_KTERU|nr:hypothetical protein [Ktedonosporobacter rubrisoli]QBD79537.1 hypothetical protein EPA93_27580 [Ktedonosporobacter rubrisoli]
MLRLSLKRWHPSRYELWMFGLVALATLARLVLIYNNWPTTNSDEGNMGLVALHVAYRGELPIFFYGLPYMGPVEGYLAAPLFHILGPSLFTLRLALIPLFVLFIAALFYLTRLLYSEKLALLIVVLFSFGSLDIISRQLKAVGEYPETELFAALICLFAAWFALSYARFSATASRREWWKRLLAYGLLGLVIGLALWVDFLILPFVASAGLLLLLFCRKELFSLMGLSLLIGCIIGIFPLIVYNVTAPLDRNSLNVLLDIHHAGAQALVGVELPWLKQIIGTVMIALPLATGANPLCPLEAIPMFGASSPLMAQCSILQGGWGLGYLALGVIAVLGAAGVAWKLWREQRTAQALTLEERQELILQCSRLMVLLSAGLTLLLYLISPSPAVVPFTSARYLTCLLIAVPALLWPLWRGLRRVQTGWGQARRIASAGILLVILAVFVLGTFRTFAEIPMAQDYYRQEGALIHKLESLGATRIYSEYWTCNRLTFHSQEKVICSALEANLAPGFDRYAPYRDIVRAAAHPAYVFPLGSQQITNFARKLAELKIACQRYTFAGYAIFLPERPVSLGRQEVAAGLVMLA